MPQSRASAAVKVRLVRRRLRARRTPTASAKSFVTPTSPTDRRVSRAKCGGVGGDDIVAGQHQPDGAAGGNAVDGDDNRHRQRRDQPDQVMGQIDQRAQSSRQISRLLKTLEAAARQTPEPAPVRTTLRTVASHSMRPTKLSKHRNIGSSNVLYCCGAFSVRTATASPTSSVAN